MADAAHRRAVNKAGVVDAAALKGGEVACILKRLVGRAGLDPATIPRHGATPGRRGR
jgi:hypothetical protein